MAAKINKTVTISLKNGFAGSKNVPTAGSVLGGGTSIKSGGKSGGASPMTGSGFGTATGVKKGKGGY